MGTTTEIYDYLRLLFARVGRTICHRCGVEVVRETVEAAARELSGLGEGTRLLVGFEMPLAEAPRASDGGGAAEDGEARREAAPNGARDGGPRPNRGRRSRGSRRETGGGGGNRRERQSGGRRD